MDPKPTPYEAGLYAYGDHQARVRAILFYRQRTRAGFIEAREAFRDATPPRRVDWERMEPDAYDRRGISESPRGRK